MLSKLISYLSLVAAYVRLNLRAQMEYRGAFLSQMLAMFLNNCVWLAFWGLFFTRFQALRGWNIQDLITLWSVAAAGFGLAHAVCGNALFLPRLIARGQLDAWMLYPRALLSHLVLGKMSPTAWGDVSFGLLVYFVWVHPDLSHATMFILLTVVAAVTFAGFSILSGSLGFYLGNSEVLSDNWRFSMITFSTYPATLFEGAIKLVLYTLIPAAFASYMPVQALKEFSWTLAGWSALGSLGVLMAGVAVFYCGLKRYESGNLVEMRG